MKLILVVMVVFGSFRSKSQGNLQTWMSTHIQVQHKHWLGAVDMGYRVYKMQLNHPVQSLGRIILGYRFEYLFLGAGYASFQH